MDCCLIPGLNWWTHNSYPVTICERKSIPIPLLSGQYFSSNVQALVFLCQLSHINLWKRILNTTTLWLWHSHFLHWFKAAAVTPHTWLTDLSKWFHQQGAHRQISKPNLCGWRMVHHSGWHPLLLTISHPESNCASINNAVSSNIFKCLWSFPTVYQSNTWNSITILCDALQYQTPL
jgi:hypothetical protein